MPYFELRHHISTLKPLLFLYFITLAQSHLINSVHLAVWTGTLVKYLNVLNSVLSTDVTVGAFCVIYYR